VKIGLLPPWAPWAILAAGFALALAVYLTAAPAPPSPIDENPLDSKTSLRDMEIIGGKANILATEIAQDFHGLWQGRTLAYTIAALASLSAWAVWFFGTHPILPEEEPEPRESKSRGSGDRG
jgi:hypothetical protein